MTKSSNIYFPTGEIEKTFIKSIWRLSDNDLNHRKEIILPKGTVEIIFNFSDTIDYFNPSLQVSKCLPSVFVNGINFKPFELTKSGRQEFLGIQLNGIGLRMLSNVSTKEFNDSVLYGRDVCPQLDNLADELYFKQSFDEQVEILLSWASKKFRLNNFHSSLTRVQYLTKLNCGQNLTIKELSRKLCLSDRQLRRLSNDWLGMKTEEFIHYSKYLDSLYLLHHSKQTLTEIGLEAGYYDQSHFIREFKSYTGLTPKQYREANTSLPGHIFA